MQVLAEVVDMHRRCCWVTWWRRREARRTVCGRGFIIDDFAQIAELRARVGLYWF